MLTEDHERRVESPRKFLCHRKKKTIFSYSIVRDDKTWVFYFTYLRSNSSHVSSSVIFCPSRVNSNKRNLPVKLWELYFGLKRGESVIGQLYGFW